jgi:hypothetical protein
MLFLGRDTIKPIPMFGTKNWQMIIFNQRSHPLHHLGTMAHKCSSAVVEVILEVDFEERGKTNGGHETMLKAHAKHNIDRQKHQDRKMGKQGFDPAYA